MKLYFIKYFIWIIFSVILSSCSQDKKSESYYQCFENKVLEEKFIHSATTIANNKCINIDDNVAKKICISENIKQTCKTAKRKK